jgi:fluoroacetyl-CoA thioesterase
VSISVGLAATATMTVGAGDTALAMRTGDVEVLATPRLVALCEEACCRALSGAVAPPQTTVGVRFQLDHLAPLRVGATLTAEATLERVEGRRLAFTVSVSHEAGLVAAGRMTRVLVERDAFLAKAR